jgi:hypothetical protein
VSSSVRNYLSGNTYLVGMTNLTGAYREDWSRQQSSRTRNISRVSSGSLRLGAGVGRLRDITPVLRALRLSERLRALGRQPLATTDVQRLADVLTRAGGYGQVFDRPDRRLWGDLLEPLAGNGSPLSAFEIFYLRDVSFEELGSRNEGAAIEGGIEIQRSIRYHVSPQDAVGPWLAAAWSRNLSLNHQVSADLRASYLSVHTDPEIYWATEMGQASVSGRHQWVVADRTTWNNRLSALFNYREVDGFDRVDRSQLVSLASQLVYYVEDRVSLAPSLSFNWQRQDPGANPQEYRSWSFSMGLNYRISNDLF